MLKLATGGIIYLGLKARRKFSYDFPLQCWNITHKNENIYNH